MSASIAASATALGTAAFTFAVSAPASTGSSGSPTTTSHSLPISSSARQSALCKDRVRRSPMMMRPAMARDIATLRRFSSARKPMGRVFGLRLPAALPDGGQRTVEKTMTRRS
eukprot:NODE_15400_length_1052_cov_3.407568.p1 GENE.NODE_15400_length_1052_cov_3.407568~~NODE_15400_length_1052_cov_3.407568.p1  ORF type:complete len:113 (-),score=21.59 NODE_15400_length_1052_cov_3.407568:414-752(-)